MSLLSPDDREKDLIEKAGHSTGYIKGFEDGRQAQHTKDQEDFLSRDGVKQTLDSIIKRERANCQKRIEQGLDEIEGGFIWGQVPYHDIESDKMKEWTMHCISDSDWQALKAKIKEVSNG